MSHKLIVYLSKIALSSRKGKQECAVQFAATLAAGTNKELKPDEEQLLALPAEIAQACRRMIADGSMRQMALESMDVPRFAGVQESTKLQLESKISVLLEGIRVKKEEDKDGNAKVQLGFKVRLNHREEWPGRELLGKWLNVSLRDSAPMREPGE